MSFLLPEQSVRTFTDLNLKDLYRRGIRILFVDIDNTLSAYGDTHCSDRAREFLEECRAHHIEPVLLTNNTKKHADEVMNGRPAGELLTFCCKPLPFSIQRVLAKRHLHPWQAAVIGDQLFTDILAGKFAGIRTILCGKASKKERADTSIMRVLESVAYGYYERRGKIERRDGYVRIL